MACIQLIAQSTHDMIYWTNSQNKKNFEARKWAGSEI